MIKTKLPDFKYEKKLYRKGYKFIAGVDEVGKGCFAGPLVTGCVIFNKQISKSANKQMDGGVTRVGGHHGRGPVLVSRRKGHGADERQDPETLFAIPEDIVINDSKQMRPKQRERSAVWIKENALAWGIGEVSAQKINSVGMSKAAKICFRKAISEARKRLGKPIDFLLADAFFISYVPGLPAKRRKNKKGRFYKKINGRQQAIVNGDEKSISIAAASIIAKVYRDSLMTKLSKRPKYRKYGWGRNKGYGTREHQNAIKKYGTTRQHRKQWIETWLTTSAKRVNNSSSSPVR